jgi:lysozyme
MIKGVDISAIQGKVDFVALAASGVQFVILRCGVGNGGIDSMYAKNVAGATAAGLKVACYHFIYPLPPKEGDPSRDPVAQAQYHFNASLGQLACIDCEWPEPQDWATWGCSSAQLNTWMLAYLQEYESLSGRKPIIYTYPNWAANVGFYQQFIQYLLWIASYEASPAIPSPWRTWVLWQNTGGGGHLPTTGVPVDTDLAEDLSLWNSVLPPIQLPVPVPTPAPIPTPVVPTPIVVSPPAPPVVPDILDNPQIDGFLTRFFGAIMNFFKHTV